MNTPMNTLNTQIYEEATEWIILHRGDELDAETKRRFDAWIRESPQHLRAYLEMSTIWEDVPTLNRDWNPDANELIARAREESNVFPLDVERVPASTVSAVTLAQASKELEPRPTPVELIDASKEPELQSVPVVTVAASQSQLLKLLAIAAMLVLTAGTSAWFLLLHNVYTTGTGEQRTLALTDGSTVELNAQTKIRVAYTDEVRTIELLGGQALFKVAKDPQRPFVVDSDGTRVRAVGTQFDVYKKAAGTQVTVVEGRVAVASGQSREVPNAPRASAEVTQGFSGPSRPTSGASSHAGSSLNIIPGEVLLSAGEQILIAEAAPELATDEGTVPVTGETPTPAPATLPRPEPANLEAATAWTQQRLLFDFAPLSEVAQEFNRYNRRPMKVECEAGDNLCSFNISGSFSSTDPTLLLRFLREQPGIVVEETASEIRILRAPKNANATTG